MSTTNASDTRSAVRSSVKNAPRSARSPPTAGSAAAAHHIDRTPTTSPKAPNVRDMRPFSPRVDSARPSVLAIFSASHDAGTGVAERLAMYGSSVALVRNMEIPHHLPVGRSRPLRSIRSSGRSMNTNASAKLKTPRVTGCTAGAAPRRSTPAWLSRGSTKKKSVLSAMTPLSVSGATAHMGSPGNPPHPGGDNSNTNQYRAPSAASPAACTGFPLLPSDLETASSVCDSPLPPAASRSSFCLRSCCLTSGATARMMEKDTSPSLKGGSTTSRAYTSLPLAGLMR
mmetsp:Transcript_10663/g.17084  ORF Transcript_10663/g.17084 Transcript_10663/m.17084 type:complete len:285 (-) Transcript_10663:678-1532(-)